MAQFTKLSEKQFSAIAGETGFQKTLIVKDYYITLILYLIKDVKGIYFKGGTALQKIFLNYARLSEDIDLSLTKNVRDVKKEITELLMSSKLFTQITQDKDVDGFIRLVIHYRGSSNEEGVIFIDMNERAKLIMDPEKHKINHFYQENIPEFSFMTEAQKEMIAGKVMAAIGRNKPRDHYDLYEIIKAKLPIDLGLVKKKSELAHTEYNIIKMFNKAKTLKNRWDSDMDPLIAERITFQEVMQTLAKYFKLKEIKEEKQKLST